jgi:signal transduction histidine kinase
MFKAGIFDTGNLLMLLATTGLMVLVYVLVRQLLRDRQPAGGVASAAGLRAADGSVTEFEELSAFASYLLQRAEEEKRQLAHRLHGDLGSTLVAVKMDVESVAEKLQDTAPELAIRLARAQATLQQAVTVKREIVDALRPSLLENLGFAAAVEWEVAETGRRAGITASATVAGETAAMPELTALWIFRALQETLNNVERHAQARNLWVEVAVAEDNVSVLVEDDGVGFADGSLRGHLGHGIAGIRQRARALRGELAIRRRPEGGALIELNIPLSRAGGT